MNKEVFEKERAERDRMRKEAENVLTLLETDPEALRSEVSWFDDFSDEEIRNRAERMLRLADSPHPLQGYWDMHGRVVDKK